MNETLNVQGRRFCPKCKRGTQVLKPEQLKLSADYLLTRGQESEDVTAGYTGRSQSYKNPSIDPMIIACLDALDRDPDDIDTYLTLAKLYYARESPRQAFYYADQGLTYSPNHEGLNDFVNRYLSKEAMEAAVDGGLDSHEDPNDVYRLAVLALQNGETLHAQELLEKTVELDFDHSGAHQALAELYL